MTAALCIWLSRFHERECLHHAHGWTCIGFVECPDYEPDEGRVP